MTRVGRKSSGIADWRLLCTGPLEGPMNMAVDEALLLSFDPGASLPIFRIYGWAPPAFSLGRFQEAASVLDLEMCRNAGIPVVRRITGGGAIYHADEITYSLVCRPDDIAAAATVKASFRALTSFLLRFYSMLGLEPQYAVDGFPDEKNLGARTPFCFAGKEAYDILIGGRKIGGNAQRRLRDVIFQHGSIPLKGRVANATRYLRAEPDQVAETVVSLGQLGVAMEELELVQLLKSSFAGEFGVALREEGLTAAEKKKADELLEEKYGSEAWNLFTP